MSDVYIFSVVLAKRVIDASFGYLVTNQVVRHINNLFYPFGSHVPLENTLGCHDITNYEFRSGTVNCNTNLACLIYCIRSNFIVLCGEDVFNDADGASAYSFIDSIR